MAELDRIAAEKEEVCRLVCCFKRSVSLSPAACGSDMRRLRLTTILTVGAFVSWRLLNNGGCRFLQAKRAKAEEAAAAAAAAVEAREAEEAAAAASARAEEAQQKEQAEVCSTIYLVPVYCQILLSLMQQRALLMPHMPF